MDDTVILLPPKPKSALTTRANGATFAGGVLTVATSDGEVTIPPAAEIWVNGFKNPAEYVPLWFEGVEREKVKAAKSSEALVAAGKRPLLVPPVHLTLADTDAGPVARFDQRV